MMFGRVRRPWDRKLNKAPAQPGGSPRLVDTSGRDGDEPARLEALATQLRRLGADTPPIDEQRVWLRVQAGMRAEPQRRSRVPRFALPGMLLGTAPRLVFGGVLAVALVVGALVGSLLLQSRASVSAAFLDEMQRMADASEVAATRGALSAAESAALEERALVLLQLASRPEVLADLGPSESELAHQRLLEARSALAGVVGENPGDTRALAALAAISGLLAPEASAGPSSTSTPDGAATSTATAAVTVVTATATASPTPQVSATAATAVTATSEATATASALGQRSEPTRSPQPQADDSKGKASPPEAAGPSGASSAASAVSGAQRACAQVYDLASLGRCKTAAAAAVVACAEARVTSGCQSTAEAAVGAAQQRVQRVGDDCQRLPSSKARSACSEATNKARESSGSGTRGTGEQKDGRNGGERNESDARGRRD